MCKGVVNVICMLHWCSNSSLNASSARLWLYGWRANKCIRWYRRWPSLLSWVTCRTPYHKNYTRLTYICLQLHHQLISVTDVCVLVCVCKFLDPASVVLYGSDMLSTSFYSHKKRSVSCLMQFKAVEVMPQITLCSLAWHAPGQTHTRSCLSGCQRPCLPFYVYTKWQEGRGTRGEQKREERWKKRWKKDSNKE